MICIKENCPITAKQLIGNWFLSFAGMETEQNSEKIKDTSSNKGLLHN